MRWRILGLLFLARVGLGFQFQTVASVGDDLIIAFGLSYADIGFLIGLFMAPGLFLAIPAGFWGRYVSDRMMVVSGLCALALGGAASSFATDSWTIGMGRVFAGAGFLFTTLYFTKMVADWFEGREIATAMSILVMSWPFGIAMGQVGHTWLAQAYGWQVPFQAASAYCLFAALGVFLLYRPPHDLPDATGGARVALTGQEWRLMLCAATAWGVFNAAYVTYLAFAPKVLESHGQTAIAAAGIISIGSWIMIFSGAACGQIVDRFGGRNTGQTHERAYALNRRSVWPKNTNWGLIGAAFHKFPTFIARIRRVNSIIFLYKDFMRLPWGGTQSWRSVWVAPSRHSFYSGCQALVLAQAFCLGLSAWHLPGSSWPWQGKPCGLKSEHLAWGYSLRFTTRSCGLRRRSPVRSLMQRAIRKAHCG